MFYDQFISNWSSTNMQVVKVDATSVTCEAYSVGKFAVFIDIERIEIL